MVSIPNGDKNLERKQGMQLGGFVPPQQLTQHQRGMSSKEKNAFDKFMTVSLNQMGGYHSIYWWEFLEIRGGKYNDAQHVHDFLKGGNEGRQILIF